MARSRRPDDTPVTAWPTDRFGRITHLEDEPPLAFAQILAEGLRIGQVVRILESPRSASS